MSGQLDNLPWNLSVCKLSCCTISLLLVSDSTLLRHLCSALMLYWALMALIWSSSKALHLCGRPSKQLCENTEAKPDLTIISSMLLADDKAMRLRGESESVCCLSQHGRVWTSLKIAAETPPRQSRLEWTLWCACAKNSSPLAAREEDSLRSRGKPGDLVRFLFQSAKRIKGGEGVKVVIRLLWEAFHSAVNSCWFSQLVPRSAYSAEIY